GRCGGVGTRQQPFALGGDPALRPAGGFWRRARTVRPDVLPDLWAVTMSGPDAPGKTRTPRTKGASERLFDRELADLPPDLRWREWMLRVEAVIFASAEPVGRETLAHVVGKDCS